MPANQDIKFVKLFEKSMMQFVILNKAKEQNGVTKDNLRQIFQGGNLRMETEHLDECVRELVQSNHLKEEGNKLNITDDGREDVQKVQHLLVEVPEVANIRAGGQTQSGGGMGQGARTQGRNV